MFKSSMEEGEEEEKEHLELYVNACCSPLHFFSSYLQLGSEMGHARFYDERRAEGVKFAKPLFFVVNIWTHLPYRVTKLFSYMDAFQVYMCGKSRVSSSLEER